MQDAVSQLMGQHHFLKDIWQITIDGNVFFPPVNQKKALAAAFKQPHWFP